MRFHERARHHFDIILDVCLTTGKPDDAAATAFDNRVCSSDERGCPPCRLYNYTYIPFNLDEGQRIVLLSFLVNHTQANIDYWERRRILNWAACVKDSWPHDLHDKWKPFGLSTCIFPPLNYDAYSGSFNQFRLRGTIVTRG